MKTECKYNDVGHCYICEEDHVRPVAQPVEGTREPEDDCNPDPHSGRLKFEHPHLPAPVEGPTADELAKQYGAKMLDNLRHNVEADKARRAPVEGVERVTDDRPAETILDNAAKAVPERWRRAYIDFLSDDLPREVLEAGYHKFLLELGRAETRIEVLEATLRKIVARIEIIKPLSRVGNENIIADIARAALPAPSGVKV